MLVLVVAGCAANKPPPVAVVPQAVTLGDDDYAAVKKAYTDANPDSRVGRVVAVLPSEKRLTVNDVPVADFKAGDVISIVDGKLNLIADGTVLEVQPDQLYVSYEPVTLGSRAPAAGDLLIRAQTPDRSTYK
jgi:ribosomal protein L24